jgi:hypothetical protein
MPGRLIVVCERPRSAFIGADCLEHLEPGFIEEVGHEHANEGFVFNDEDDQAGLGIRHAGEAFKGAQLKQQSFIP